MLNSVTNQLV